MIKSTTTRRRMIGSLLSLSMLALATPGFAENRANAFTVSPFIGGYTFDHEQLYQNMNIAPMVGVRAGYNFTENWGAEARFGYVRADSRAAHHPLVDVYSYGIDALYHFNLAPKFVPYVAAGIGGMQHSFRDKKAGYYPEYAANYGVGVKYFVAENVALRADVRHVILPDDMLNNVEYTAGVTFQFGGNQQATVVQPAPVAVVQPAPVVAPAPVVVVEVPVPVKDTTAPTVSLTAPVKDATDADTHKEISVAFSEPIDPATLNDSTFTLQQGNMAVPGRVTHPNATSASYIEANDLAPGTTYTGRITTGVRDLAGNALANDYVWNFTTAPLPPQPVTQVVTKVETVVEKKTVVINKFVMLGKTHFKFDKATLTPSGKEELNKNIKIMKENPEIKVIISGHTSAAGSAKYNQGLSERRAEAAKTYLVQEGGIAAERIETIGYGESRPAMVESNPAHHNSAAAKANMRILFEVAGK